ncbi:MAG TPA: SpvB/TcaC N-terminal domain-containing protein, partial [Polyangia bacterium]|nr:SpvB/TcaC N-terminal domain-containing protein [Polyangia bacterium]
LASGWFWYLHRSGEASSPKIQVIDAPNEPGLANIGFVYGLNDLGEAVGPYYPADYSYSAGALYTEDGGVQMLDGLVRPSPSDWVLQFPTAINNAHQIVGLGTHGGQQTGFKMDLANGAVIDLCRLEAPYDGAGSVPSPRAINSAGHVVGTVSEGGSPVRAFIYTDTSGITDLNTLIDPALGWTLRDARAINDADVVVGYAENANGERRAYKLALPVLPDPTPCPAPDGCHLPGTRDLTGVCSYPPRPDGTACDDGQTCTQTEICSAGTCQPPANPPPVVVNLPVDNLGTLGGASLPGDINASGVVVGYSAGQAWKWNGSGPLINLGLASPSIAYAINDSGTIAGYQTFGDGTHAFRYGAADPEDFGLIGDGSLASNEVEYVRGSQAYSINNSGQFAGFYTDGGVAHGFRFTDGVPAEDVGSLAGDLTMMWGISDSGAAVGTSWSVAGDPWSGHAVLFENAIVGLVDLNDIIDPTAGWTLTYAFSASGDYIAGLGIHNGEYRAYRLHRSPGSTTGTIDEINGGWLYTSAYDVNAAGDVVGAGFPVSYGAIEAFAFTDQLGFKKLNDLIPQNSGWDLSSGYSINASGTIVGQGNHAGDGGPLPFRLNLAPQAVACGGSANMCGGGPSGDVCLWAEGVVDVGGGQYAGVFGFQNAATTSVHPAVNQVLVDGQVDATFHPAPPAFLMSGVHPAAYVPRVAAGHSIAWRVDGQTVSVTAPAPGSGPPAGTRVLPTVPIGTNGVGVMIDGVLVTIKTDTAPPTNPAVQHDPDVGDPFNGVLAGQLSVSPTGAATYSVPITIPPGISGMAPNLSLVYNSQGGDGLAGQGWDLSGLSVIHRCAKTVVQDGYNRPVHMNGLEPDPDNPDPNGLNQDGICIDGKRLFQRSISPRVYETENKDFSIITRYYDNPGLASGKATYFTVVTKKGETRFYGLNTKSRVRFPIEEDDVGSGGDEIAVWALDRVVDAWGNYYDVEYNGGQADFQARGLIVTKISYTGHFEGSRTNPRDGSTIFVPAVPPFTSVRFTYENRTDVRQTRFRKATLRRWLRLKTIATDAGIYTLDYLPPGDPMLPSRLTTIGYCALPSTAYPAGQCLKSLDFGWEGGDYHWDSAPNFALPAGIDQDFTADPPVQTRGNQLVDLNGDGRPDFVSSPAFDDPIGAWRNTGSGWAPEPTWALPNFGGRVLLADENNAPAKSQFADMDGDGLLDLVGSPYSCITTCGVTCNNHCDQ